MYQKDGFVDWEPFRPQLSKYIVRHSTVIASYDREKPDVVMSFSFGTYVRVKAGVRHRVDFYCNQYENNPAMVLAHIQKHFILLSQFKFTDVINVSMLLPNCTDQSQIRRFLVEELELGPLVTQAIW